MFHPQYVWGEKYGKYTFVTFRSCLDGVEIIFVAGITLLKGTRQSFALHARAISGATISDNNIGQWLPFPPYLLPNVVLQVQKNIERKVDIIVATLKEGKRGRAFV